MSSETSSYVFNLVEWVRSEVEIESLQCICLSDYHNSTGNVMYIYDHTERKLFLRTSEIFIRYFDRCQSINAHVKHNNMDLIAKNIRIYLSIQNKSWNLWSDYNAK